MNSAEARIFAINKEELRSSYPFLRTFTDLQFSNTDQLAWGDKLVEYAKPLEDQLTKHFGESWKTTSRDTHVFTGSSLGIFNDKHSLYIRAGAINAMLLSGFEVGDARIKLFIPDIIDQLVDMHVYPVRSETAENFTDGVVGAGLFLKKSVIEQAIQPHTNHDPLRYKM